MRIIVFICFNVSDLYRIKYVQVDLEKSSTIVGKWYAPDEYGVLYPPQMSQCIKSKIMMLLLLLNWNDNLLYFALIQASQGSLKIKLPKMYAKKKLVNL
jgi:hypothetical protein